MLSKRVPVLLFLCSFILPVGLYLGGNSLYANNYDFNAFLFQETQQSTQQQQDTIPKDSTEADSVKNYEPSKRPTFQFQDRYGDPFSSNQGQSPLQLGDPAALSLDVEIDTGLNYTIYEKIGDVNFRPTSSMSFEEFSRYQDEKILNDYWKERSLGLDGESAVSGRQLIPPLYVSPAFDRLFGGSFVEIIPNGFITLDFGGRFTKNENPNIPVQQQRYSSFEFDQQINMNAVGKVGEKLAVTANFANNNSFDFQNDLKVEYTGFEEEIIKKIEIGNVSMPVNNSLITGAQNLFGIKTQLQFGHLFVTSVASTQRGTSETIRVEGGAQRQEFDVRASDYDENRHFFLGHFFRDNYENWLSSMPRITSGLDVRRVEVFVINRTQNTNSLRSVAAFMDLGEANPNNVNKNELLLPSVSAGTPTNNDANRLWDQLQPFNKDYNNFLSSVESLSPSLSRTVDYEAINVARKLEATEYTIDKQLGYISLRRQLQNDEMLAVAYEYSYNGARYQVGELAENYGNRPDDEVVILKLLRPSKINTDVPSWDLMMKNIYNLNGNQISQEGFELRIIYRDDRTGQDNPSLHESSLRDTPLLRLFNLDSLNQNGDPQPDGNFDYVSGVTINEVDGKIIFPVLEPFGQRLSELFRPDEQTFRGKYVFNTLYESTKNDAQQLTSKDKFFIKGQYQSGSSSEIALPGINISPNSVRVSSGGTQLQEGLDYRVDYNLGRVIILNEGILSSGRDLAITFEKADLFNFQSRTLVGTRFDYVLSDKINFGATVLRHTQRPLGVSRYSIGSEPTNNTKWGIDINYSDEMPFLTKMVDFIPFIDTKEPSILTFRGEFAQMVPGTSNQVDGEGTSYIDDFEQSITVNNLGSDINGWKISSTPATPDKKFVGTGKFAENKKRAKLAWYSVDNIFYRKNGANVPELTDEALENHYARSVVIQEIYKNRDRNIGVNLLPTFDLAYFPEERGVYNYNSDLTAEGKLKNPKSNWAGISRAITSEVDFDKNNIEYIEFWLMDPFIDSPRGVVDDGSQDAAPNTTGGKLYFNLGSVSEDVLGDGQLSYENGLPADYDDLSEIEITEYARVPENAPITDVFSNETGARGNQDVGLDGVRNDQEASFYSEFVDEVNSNASLSAEAKQRILDDPSADNFKYFLGDDFDARQAPLLERYKNFNNPEGNTPGPAANLDFNPSGSRYPDSEDLNDDKTISTLEEFYEYEVNLTKDQLSVSSNPLIVDEAVSDEDGIKWYLFRIPIRNPTRTQGDIQGFKTIRFIRTILTDFEQPVVLRMADFRLVGSQWRKYDGSLARSGISETPEDKRSNLVVSVVNIESNSENGPGKVPYTLPPGIQRDQDVASVANQVRQNEQSIQLCVDDFEDGKAVAAFKNVNFDLVNYGKLKMFLHAQSPNANDDEITAFVRFGTDFDDNYYEIELPLKVTPYQATDPREIWPEENEIALAFDELYKLKSRRNRFLGSQNVLLPYTEEFGKYTLTVRGRPDMSSLQTIMIGMRNPAGGGGLPKDVCMWANEMRVTEFDQTSGWAANASVNTKLADFANITASTRYTSVGFGGIEENISQRTRESSLGFDVSGNVSLGKFFKEESGIKIPMYLGYQTFTATPFYDPRDPDIPLSASLEGFDDAEEREEYRQIVIDQEERRSINFTNVRKERKDTEKIVWPIAISNFDFTYAYNDITRSNLQTATYETRNYKGAIGYNYGFPNASIAPLETVAFLKSPYLKLIRDININPLPSTFSFRGDLDRSFVKTQLRNDMLTTQGIDAQFEKSFTLARAYNLNWNLTQNINLNYTARAFAIVDEEEGEINTEAKRDSILTNLSNLGRMKNFDQSIVAGYSIPLDKIPFTDWVTADARYKVDFNWTSGSLNQIDTLGHIIQNSSEWGLNSRLDMTKLYNKVRILNSINNPPRLRANEVDSTWAQPGAGVVKGFLNLLMSLKNVTANYSERSGTLLPGFRNRAYLFGLDSSMTAPGLPFILGSQDPSIRTTAADKNWLAKSESQSTLFTQSIVRTLDVKAMLEPMNDLTVQIDFNRVINENYSETFRYSQELDEFASFTPTRSGNYSVSYNMIKTSFVKTSQDNSPLFDQFRENREEVHKRLSEANPNKGEYLLNQQDVLIPAFLAAYTETDASQVSLNPFPKFPLPNWRIDYKGLSNIKAIKKIFPSVTISHAYNASFNVSNFISNGRYDSQNQNLTLNSNIENYPFPSIQSDSGNFIPVYNIGQVLISERFSPLIGVNLRTKGRFTAKLEYKKERNLALSTETSQLTDQKSNDFVIDIGFTDPSFKFPFKIKGRTVALKNDLTMQLSVTVRDTEVVQRSVDDDRNVLVDGNINYQLRPTVNYTVSEKLNLNFYYQRSFNEPRVQNSFPTTNTSFGVQVRFGLQ
ncbi:cell surface protein SprA [Marivirga sp. S37H4]|uniref:Cell surface protein SprA n=1 Tax=Marivirga aurantiaca TaxID=2802615 RepID=A0A934WXX1_9BACT|nr:cell surface protein SprA [Marivirga aurantiaca]MBK6265184.1 cell surface protein SprA [Marivirga aurantiaca]